MQTSRPHLLCRSDKVTIDFILPARLNVTNGSVRSSLLSVPTADQAVRGAPSLSTCQNQFLSRLQTILSSSSPSPSSSPSSFTAVPSFVRTALHHCFVLIASTASCLCSSSSHPLSTNFASMAPSSSIASDETIPQRARSKSDADIDYSSSKGKSPSSAFIYTMLVMFCMVIRRFGTDRVSLPAHWALVSTTRFPSIVALLLLSDDASASWSTRLF